MRGLSTNERIIVSALRSAGRITIETTTEDGGIIRVAVTGRKPVHGIADTLRTILKLFNTR